MKFNLSRNCLLVISLAFLGCASAPQQDFVRQDTDVSIDRGDYDQIRMLYNNGEFEQAAEGATHLISDANSNAAGYYQMAQNLEVRIKSKAMTDIPGAIKDLSLLLNNSPNRDPDRASYLGLLYIFEGETSKGSEIIYSFSDEDTSFGEKQTSVTYYRIAAAYLALAEIEKAQEYFAKAVSNNDEYGRVCASQGVLGNWGYCFQSDIEITLDRGYFTAFKEAIDLWVAGGDPAEAVNILQSLDPSDFEFERAIVLGADEARNVYDHFIVNLVSEQISTQSANFNNSIESATGPLLARGEYQTALETLGALYLSRPEQKVIESIALVSASYQNNEPTEDARMHLARANIYLGEQNYPLAIDSYRQMISVSPWVFGAFFNLALIYGTDEQYGQAIKTMQHFLLLDPNSAQSRQARDQIYEWELRAEL